MNMKRSVLALLTLVVSIVGSHSAIAETSGMTSPTVEFSFVSQDNQPVEGVGLTGMMLFEVKRKSCADILCFRKTYHWQNGSEGGVVVGTTDANGKLTVPPMAWETEQSPVRDLYVQFFTNGLIWDVCKDEENTKEDIVDLLPQWQGTTPVVRNEECKTVYANEGESATLKISCISPFTHAQILAKKTEKLALCKPKAEANQ